MIYTVFPLDDHTPWQDFSTYKEAKEYAEENLDCEYVIEATDGEVV